MNRVLLRQLDLERIASEISRSRLKIMFIKGYHHHILKHSWIMLLNGPNLSRVKDKIWILIISICCHLHSRIKINLPQKLYKPKQPQKNLAIIGNTTLLKDINIMFHIKLKIMLKIMMKTNLLHIKYKRKNRNQIQKMERNLILRNLLDY